MKPYCQTDLGTLYHGDCLEILPKLPPVDLVLTDPPYGINYQSAWRTDKSQRKPKIHGDDQYPLWVFDIRPTVALFVWCRWDNLVDIPKPKSFIVWDKMVHSMGDLKHEFGRRWDGIAFYPGPKHQFIKRPIDIIRFPKIQPEALLHPNEKPVGVVIPLIEAHIATSVLDPFLGSGTTAVACERLGRKWIGIEISEEYCEISAKRIDAEARQGKLFG